MAALITAFDSDVPAPVNFVLMRGLLSAARKRLPYFNGTLPGNLEKSQGSASVKWRRINNLSAVTTALAEVNGTAAAFLGRDAVRPTVTDVTVATAMYGNAILVNERVDLFNVNSKSAQLMDVLGANAGESLNIIMRDEFNTGFTKIRYASGVANDSAVAAAISLNDIKWSVNQLNRLSAMTFMPIGTGSVNYNSQPIRSAYYGITHPDVEEDIRALTGFVGIEQYGGYAETLPYEFGSVGGVRWCATEISPISSAASGVSSNLLRGTTAAPDVYSTFIYGREAVGSVGLGNMHATTSYEMYDPSKPPAVELIVHQPGTSGIFDMYNEMGSLAWKTWFAAKTLNADWGVKLRTGASKLV
jgi:N4-gp56 family major capsid protein